MSSERKAVVVPVPSIEDTTPRRAFKKSRKGCKTCKARKVKCDERRPICGGCSRRYPRLKSCEFDGFIETSVANFKPSSGAPKALVTHESSVIESSITIRPSAISSSDERRVLELRLMHHYTTSTCRQLPEGASSQGIYMWSKDIPRLAFDSDLVLNALLGISALHHSALTPTDRELSQAAEVYFDRAVRYHRIALSNPDDKSAESLLATAILICHHAWLAAHVPHPNQQYEIPLQTYHMARGIQALFAQMWPQLRGSGYLWYVEHLPVADIEEGILHGSFLASSQEDLAILSDTFDHAEVSLLDRSIYEMAIAELTSLYYAISTNELQSGVHRRVATMPLKLPARFLKLVELKDPRALVLLARNISLLEMIPHVWWLHGAKGSHPVAETAIFGISSMLPSEWLWAMCWPSRVVSGEFHSLHHETRKVYDEIS